MALPVSILTDTLRLKTSATYDDVPSIIHELHDDPSLLFRLLHYSRGDLFIAIAIVHPACVYRAWECVMCLHVLEYRKILLACDLSEHDVARCFLRTSAQYLADVLHIFGDGLVHPALMMRNRLSTPHMDYYHIDDKPNHDHRWIDDILPIMDTFMTDRQRSSLTSFWSMESLNDTLTASRWTWCYVYRDDDKKAPLYCVSPHRLQQVRIAATHLARTSPDMIASSASLLMEDGVHQEDRTTAERLCTCLSDHAED